MTAPDTAHAAAQAAPPPPTGSVDRRALLGAALVSALAAAPAVAATSGAAAPADWPMTFEVVVRLPHGRGAEWDRFWGDTNVAILEDAGQWLQAAWRDITGPQDVITHLWNYRDLAHYQAMNAMRGNNSKVPPLPIQIESVLSSMMTRLPYHPATPPARAAQPGIIATHRIVRQGQMGGPNEHRAAMERFIPLATGHGAQLVGAYESYFGWTPSYMLHVWRYPDIAAYLETRRAIEADPQAAELMRTMRKVHPNETVELNLPTSYSRLR